MRIFAGVTSMLFVVAPMGAGCVTGGKTTSGVTDKAAPTVLAGPADAVMYINGLSCPL